MSMTIPHADLRRLIRATAPVASKDDFRPILCGVLLAFDPKAQTLTATATDSYQLHIAVLNVKAEGKAWSANVPAAWLARWASERFSTINHGTPRRRDMRPHDVIISLRADRFSLQTGDDHRSISVIGGQYPDTERLIKRKPTKAEAQQAIAGFDPAKFGRLVKCADAWHHWNNAPMQAETWAPLGPCQFKVEASHGTLTMVLMPVRVTA